MKKLIVILGLGLVPALSFAVNDANIDALMKASIKEIEKKGLPTPGSGIQVVPTDASKAKNLMQKQVSQENSEMLKNGFINRTSDRAYELLHIDEKIKKHAETESKMFKGTDTHLRQSADELSLAYTYFGVPQSEIKTFFGIAPVGSYKEEGKNIGWTGATAFFETSFGRCSYTENNIILQGSAVRLPEEFVSYEVNDKITLIDIVGNESSGFLYHINWFDSAFNHNLECATKKFSESDRLSTINLAKNIDIYNQNTAFK